MDICSLVVEQTPDPQNHSKIFGAIATCSAELPCTKTTIMLELDKILFLLPYKCMRQPII